MCMHLEIFFEESHDRFRSFLDDFEELNLEKDSSGYVFIDGEEGDYGDIKYFRNLDINGAQIKLLVCTHVIYGGDSDYWEYTPYGKELLKGRLKLAMNKWLETI